MALPSAESQQSGIRGPPTRIFGWTFATTKCTLSPIERRGSYENKIVLQSRMKSMVPYTSVGDKEQERSGGNTVAGPSRRDVLA